MCVFMHACLTTWSCKCINVLLQEPQEKWFQQNRNKLRDEVNAIKAKLSEMSLVVNKMAETQAKMVETQVKLAKKLDVQI